MCVYVGGGGGGVREMERGNETDLCVRCVYVRESEGCRRAVLAVIESSSLPL